MTALHALDSFRQQPRDPLPRELALVSRQQASGLDTAERRAAITGQSVAPDAQAAVDLVDPDEENAILLDPLATVRRAMQTAGLSRKTVQDYGHVLARLESWLWQTGRGTLEHLTCDHLADWVAAEVQPTYASKKLARHAVAKLVDALELAPELAEVIRTPRAPRTKPRPLTKADEQRIDREAARWEREGLAVRLMLHTAIRRSEVAGLRWEGWRPEEGVLRVWRPKVSDWHNVPWPEHLTAPMMAQRRRVEGPYVFPGTEGRHVAGVTVSAWTKRIADRAGVYCTPHMLRHTRLTRVQEAARNLRITQDLAGHADPRQTMRYTEVTMDQIAAAMQQARDDLNAA